MENILKEKLKTSVDIDEGFSKELLGSLIEKNSSKLTKNNGMNTSFLKRFVLATLSLVAVCTVLVGAYFVVDSYYPNIFRLDKSELAKVSVEKGSIKVNGDTLSTKLAYLKAGDVVQAQSNSFVLVKSDGIDVYMDSNAQVAFNELNGKLYPYVEYGRVVISSASGNTDQIRAEVGGVDVLITSGSALSVQNVEKRFNETASIFDMFVSKAYAGETQTESSVLGLSGTVLVKKGTQEVVVPSGLQVNLEEGKLTTPVEGERESLKTIFCEDVANEEEENNKDTGTLEDVTDPVITLLSPENGSVVKTNKVTVSFKSNEDGWYNNGSWKELKANEVVSYTKALKGGKNEISIIVKDKFYNKSIKSISVTYDVVEKISWSAVPQARESGVYLSWNASGALAGDYFKLFRNGSMYKAIKVTSENRTGDTYLDTNTTYGKTYKYEVKIRRGDTYLADSTSVAILSKTGGAPESNDTGSTSGSCGITLTKVMQAQNPSILTTYTEGSHFLKISWNVYGDCPEHSGYKLVWNKTGNPVYPGDTYHYISDISDTTDTISGLGTGTYYVRVSLYIDGVGKYYSNQLVVSY